MLRLLVMSGDSCSILREENSTVQLSRRWRAADDALRAIAERGLATAAAI